MSGDVLGPKLLALEDEQGNEMHEQVDLVHGFAGVDGLQNKLLIAGVNSMEILAGHSGVWIGDYQFNE